MGEMAPSAESPAELLRKNGFDFLVDGGAHRVTARELEGGEVLQKPGELRWAPWVTCVAGGSVVIERAGAELEIGAGRLFAQLGPYEFGSGLRVPAEQCKVLIDYTIRAGPTGALVVEHEGAYVEDAGP